MKELLFSKQRNTFQENAQGFAEVFVIGASVSFLGAILAKATGLLSPNPKITDMEQRAVLMFLIVLCTGYMGAMFGSEPEENKQSTATHQSELLGCLIGSMVGVIIDMAVLNDIRTALLKDAERKEKQREKIKAGFRV